MRGYIVVNHGGVAGGITQTNDIDLYKHQRRLYMEKAMAEMLRLSRTLADMLPSPMREQCIDWMFEVVAPNRPPRRSAVRLQAHWGNERVGWERSPFDGARGPRPLGQTWGLGEERCCLSRRARGSGGWQAELGARRCVLPRGFSL